ncbi:MAG: hypothetical protein FWE63_02295 [Bacteroidales bacterium]|nr:hypothetical protein [Bacteroidales bacterium]
MFEEEKISLGLCQNYGRYGERTNLLFKARTKVLNNYIKDKIARGELEDKEFEIWISDPIYIRGLFIGQENNVYSVSMSGYSFPSLDQLIRIVDYFTKPDWEPIAAYYERRENETEEAAEKRYEAEEQKVSDLFEATIEQIVYQPFIIWERDGVSLEYSGDRLKYVINGTPLPFKVNSTLPAKIHNRYLFFEREYIYVVQDMKIIKTHKIEFEDLWRFNLGEDYAIFTDSKWVNICWHSEEDSWFYRYSYDENEFYKNERWK